MAPDTRPKTASIGLPIHVLERVIPHIPTTADLENLAAICSPATSLIRSMDPQPYKTDVRFHYLRAKNTAFAEAHRATEPLLIHAIRNENLSKLGVIVKWYLLPFPTLGGRKYWDSPIPTPIEAAIMAHCHDVLKLLCDHRYRYAVNDCQGIIAGLRKPYGEWARENCKCKGDDCSCGFRWWDCLVDYYGVNKIKASLNYMFEAAITTEAASRAQWKMCKGQVDICNYLRLWFSELRKFEMLETAVEKRNWWAVRTLLLMEHAGYQKTCNPRDKDNILTMTERLCKVLLQVAPIVAATDDARKAFKTVMKIMNDLNARVRARRNPFQPVVKDSASQVEGVLFKTALGSRPHSERSFRHIVGSLGKHARKFVLQVASKGDVAELYASLPWTDKDFGIESYSQWDEDVASETTDMTERIMLSKWLSRPYVPRKDAGLHGSDFPATYPTLEGQQHPERCWERIDLIDRLYRICLPEKLIQERLAMKATGEEKVFLGVRLHFNKLGKRREEVGVALIDGDKPLRWLKCKKRVDSVSSADEYVIEFDGDKGTYKETDIDASRFTFGERTPEGSGGEGGGKYYKVIRVD
ncbi:hypothetical protein F5Y17DRAFT_457161 [Xylariaceae sp. FL0594]|nr:hypothetical protein F5Y17DRAFT_457161 [Xylariaceae sp. FL0594]